MTNEHKYQKISAEVRVSNGIAYGFVLGLVGLVVSCSGAQGNVNATLTGTGLASAAGFAYGMANATEKDVKEHNERQQRIREQNELTTLLNKPRRFVAMECLSPEQLKGLNLLLGSLGLWDDVVKTASGVPRIAVGTYVLELQKMKREVTYLDWPQSFTLVRDTLIAYMDCVIKKFHKFQTDQIGWRWTGEIEERKKYIELALEQVGVMERY